MTGLAGRFFLCAIFVAGASFADDNKPLANDLKPFQGLWSGSWGGGDANGVVFQPVLAEMVIHGDRVEVAGFRAAQRLRGTVRVDRAAKKLAIMPVATDSRQNAQKEIEYSYELKSDGLTLTDSDQVPVYLKQQPLQTNPLANVTVQLVAADEITDAGDLRVTEFTSVKAIRVDAPFHRAESRLLKTTGAAVFQSQEHGIKKISIQDARGSLKKSTPVVVAYRIEPAPALQQVYSLWKDVGAVSPDNEAAWQTYSRLLRPGTLIFVLSSAENQPVP
jgi:hypothetical protein